MAFGSANALRQRAITPLVPIDVYIAWGQSTTTWARDDVSELPGGQSYYPNDTTAKVWDNASQKIVALKYGTLASGGNEQQPSNTFLDSAFQSGIGWLPEAIKRYRVAKPNGDFCYFGWSKGGMTYDDFASDPPITPARTGNWLSTLSDGACSAMEADWLRFVAALNCIGRTPRIIAVLTDGGVYSNSSTSPAGRNATQPGFVNAHQTNFEATVARLRNSIFGKAKVYLMRHCSIPLSGSNCYNNATYGPTARALQEAVPANSSGLIELMNVDNMASNPTGGNDHPKAAGMATVGMDVETRRQGLWHPGKEILELGGNPSLIWLKGDIANSPVAGPFSTVFNYGQRLVGSSSRDMTQATGSFQPTLTTINNRRGMVFDGTDDIVQNSLPFITGLAGGTSVYFVVKAPAQASANCSLFGEGGAGNPFWLVRGDASGNLTFIYRDDAGGNLAILTLAASAFNNVLNFVEVHDNLTSITGVVNGVAGSAQAYTRGTTTMTRQCLGGNGATQFFNGTVMDMWCTNAVSDATQKANARAYAQREYGTP